MISEQETSGLHIGYLEAGIVIGTTLGVALGAIKILTPRFAARRIERIKESSEGNNIPEDVLEVINNQIDSNPSK